MKKQNGNKGTVVVEKNSFQGVIDEMIKENQEQGSVELNAFCSKVGCSPLEGVHFLRTVPNGLFITGRRGHPSRFVFGKTMEEWHKHKQQRDEWRNKRMEKNGESRIKISDGTKAARFSLNVNVGGQTTQIPLEVELVPVH